MAKEKKDSDAAIVRRMGEPSWLILRALDPSQGIAGIQIIQRVEDVLQRANYPYQHLDPATLHYALKRMQDDGLVRCEGEQETDVPGPHGTHRRARRPVYVITGLGSSILQRRVALDAVLSHQALRPGLLAARPDGGRA